MYFNFYYSKKEKLGQVCEEGKNFVVVQGVDFSEEIFFNVINLDDGAIGIYNGLTDEAKVIYLEYLINNADMYEYHMTHVGTNIEEELKLLSKDSVSMQPTQLAKALSKVQILSNNLDFIKELSVSVGCIMVIVIN